MEEAVWRYDEKVPVRVFDGAGNQFAVIDHEHAVVACQILNEYHRLLQEAKREKA